LSSSAVRELGRYGVDLSDWVPREIIEDVRKKMGSRR
jgi:pantetheine-phosphate adenylyltransferase